MRQIYTPACPKLDQAAELKACYQRLEVESSRSELEMLRSGAQALARRLGRAGPAVEQGTGKAAQVTLHAHSLFISSAR